MSSPTTRSEEQPMSNPGMDADVFAQFIEQLQRYVRERLLPAEKEIVETDRIPDAILAEMRDMGLFGLTITEEFGGAGRKVSQYVKKIRTVSYEIGSASSRERECQYLKISETRGYLKTKKTHKTK